MDEDQQKNIEELFDKISMNLAETGKVAPLYIIVLEDDSILPIITCEDQHIDLTDYTELSVKTAHEMNAKTLLFICEQSVVRKKKDDPCIQAMLSGQIKPSEHPDKEDYLFLYNIESAGTCHSIMAKIHSDLVGTRYIKDYKWVKNVDNDIAKNWKER